MTAWSEPLQLFQGWRYQFDITIAAFRPVGGSSLVLLPFEQAFSSVSIEMRII
jgi:hypothetical protein